MRWSALLFVAGACAPSVADAPDATSSSGTSGGATTAMLDSGADASVSVSSTHDGTSTGASDESNEFPGDSGPIPDLFVPEIVRCESSPSQQIDLVITSPEGEFSTAYGWWGWNACCGVRPWLVLADTPHIEVTTMGQVMTPHLDVHIGSPTTPRGVYQGPLPIMFNPPSTVQSEHVTGFELLEPLDPEAPADGELPLFSGSFAIDEAGWYAQGTAIVPHCEALYAPPCPCE